MGNILSQIFLIPTPTLTEKNCPDQTGRVFLVTGGYAGCGFELSKILYAHNAIVCIAGRSEAKAQRAISEIKQAAPRSNGRLEFLHVDLADLATVKPAVQAFMAKHDRLDVLVNNAGVMFPPKGSQDAHGNDLQVGTNCLGPLLLYHLLEPLLTKTAASSPTGTVRVAWAGSLAIYGAPQPHGLSLDAEGRPADLGLEANYAQTKVANVIFAREFARSATPRTGVVHAAFNPGNLRTELQRHWKGVGAWVADTFLLYPAVFGGYTELWTVLAPEITPDKSGAWVVPWGRFGTLPAGLEKSIKEGKEGVAVRFLGWCERQIKPFA